MASKRRRSVADELLCVIIFPNNLEFGTSGGDSVGERVMEGWVRSAVEAIHSSPTQAVLYVSGGASQALGHLMSVPGASNTVLESVVPYSRMSMIQLLGKVVVLHPRSDVS